VKGEAGGAVLALFEVNGTIEILMNVSEMFALEFERSVVSSKDTS